MSFSQNALPSNQASYNDFVQEPFCEDEYVFEKAVWKKINCKNLKDNTSVYLASDVVSLAEVSMEFSATILDLYKIEPKYYLSTLSLAYDTILVMMKPNKIELIIDQEIYLFIERAIYGGLVSHNDRYVTCDPKDTENQSYGLCLVQKIIS